MSHEIHTHIEEESEKEARTKSFPSKIIRILIVIAVLIILFFISIGIVKVVPKMISSIGGAAVFLSSGLSNDNLKIEPLEKEIASKSQLAFNWTNTSEEEGSLYWSFKCVSGVSVSYQSTVGRKPVVCETGFPLPNEKKGEYGFFVESKNVSKTEVPFTISFYDKTGEKILLSDSDSVTIVQKDTAEETEKQTSSYDPAPIDEEGSRDIIESETENTTASEDTVTINQDREEYENRPVYSGKPDLTLAIKETGVLGVNGENYKSINEAKNGDSIIIKFKVSNIGTAPSGLWILNAFLPTQLSSATNFTSGYKPSIGPGASYDMNMIFNNFDGSISDKIILNIISNNENSTANNSLSIAVPKTSDDDSSNNNNGKADLRVKIIDTGVLNSNNRFSKTSSFDEDDTIAVKFEIINAGGKSSGSFEIEATLPTKEDENFTKTISSMRPQETREFIVGFDNPETGRNTIEIDIDTDDDVSESNENNNRATVRIDVDN